MIGPDAGSFCCLTSIPFSMANPFKFIAGKLGIGGHSSTNLPTMSTQEVDFMEIDSKVNTMLGETNASSQDSGAVGWYLMGLLNGQQVGAKWQVTNVTPTFLKEYLLYLHRQRRLRKPNGMPMQSAHLFSDHGNVADEVRSVIGKITDFEYVIYRFGS
jgi:hypothetical protein